MKLLDNIKNKQTCIPHSLVGNTTGKNNSDTVAEIMKQTTIKPISVKEQKYSSTEQYLLHRIAELEEENEMLKTLYVRIEGEKYESNL